LAGEEDESEPNVILLDPLEFRRSCIACIIGEWCDSVGLTLRPAEGFDEICNSGSMPHCRLFALSVGGSSVAADPVRADIEKARMLFPDAPLVIMSDLDSQDEVRAAYYCGARGFVPTSLDLDVTLRALRFILGGGSYFPPSALSPASLRVGIDTSRAGADSPTVAGSARRDRRADHSGAEHIDGSAAAGCGPPDGRPVEQAYCPKTRNDRSDRQGPRPPDHA
jgi:DNA-binding NarL/FixJ family response regulator